MKKTIFLICLYLLTNIKIEAQSLLERTRNRVKEKIEQRIEEKTDEAVEKGLDKTEDAIKKSGKKVKKQTTTDTNQTTEESDEETNGAKTNKTKMESYTKYDFIPGDKVLYFEDFSQDAIGDFPALWTTNGGGEVKTVNIAPGNWFHMNKEQSVYCYTKKIAFPQNFIMEFDIIPDDNFQNSVELCFYEDTENIELTDDLYPGKKGLQIFMDEESWGAKGYIDNPDLPWLESRSTTNPCETDKVNHVILWIQNRRLRIYHQGAKVLDAPTTIYEGTKFNKIRFSSWSSYCKPFVSNLKVTTAAPDTRSKLITEGKLVSYGIYFDVNKDVVKPESFGTLNDIAKVLKENPTVRIKIVGHTDADGADASNLDLSKRRGTSVKNELVKTFGIDASRIESDGLGETKPIAPNDTPANKALNRRVEFIKL